MAVRLEVEQVAEIRDFQGADMLHQHPNARQTDHRKQEMEVSIVYPSVSGHALALPPLLMLAGELC